MANHTDRWIVCRAKRSDGEPCRAPAIRGARVCRVHGGSTRHIRDAANKRIEELVLPAVSKLRVLLLRGDSHTIQLKAATEILDRAGIVATQQVDVDNHVSITVSYSDVELARKVIDADVPGIVYESLPEPGSNGHAPRNGHEKAAPEGGDDERSE